MNLFMFIGFKIWGMGAVEKVFILGIIIDVVTVVIQGITISPSCLVGILIDIVEWIIFMLLGYPPKPIMFFTLIASLGLFLISRNPIGIMLNLPGLILSYIFVF